MEEYTRSSHDLVKIEKYRRSLATNIAPAQLGPCLTNPQKYLDIARMRDYSQLPIEGENILEMPLLLR